MKKIIPYLFIFSVVCYLLLLIYPALTGELQGTMRTHNIPQEYVKLEEFLQNQQEFFRTFWIPSMQRYSFYSFNHPAVPAQDFYAVASASGVVDKMQEKDAEKALQESSVKYIIVPYDSDGEIFLKDRKYNDALYQYTIRQLQQVPWLTEITGFGRIHVFLVSNSKSHFWLASGKGSVQFKPIDPTQYEVSVISVVKGDRLVFADTYNANWQAMIDNRGIASMPYSKLNSFILTKSGSYSLTVSFIQQKWTVFGLWVSAITASFIILFSLFLLKKTN